MPSARDAHRKDHELVAEAITEDWLATEKLLVHLAREHGHRVEDVANHGLSTLIVMHDSAHGGVCFTEAEKTLNEGAQRGLARLRDRAN